MVQGLSMYMGQQYGHQYVLRAIVSIQKGFFLLTTFGKRNYKWLLVKRLTKSIGHRQLVHRHDQLLSQRQTTWLTRFAVLVVVRFEFRGRR